MIAGGGDNIEVASGVHEVWILKKDGSIRVGDGEQNSWTRIPGNKNKLEVSNTDNVWGVNGGGYLYRYRGRGDWAHIDGGAIQLTVGESGVWHVNGHGTVYYRVYTYNDHDTDGSGWDTVSTSPKMKYLASGTNILLGISTSRQLYYRAGMSTGNPKGTRWVHVPGVSLDKVAVQHNLVIGIDSNNNVKYSNIYQ